MTQVMLDDDSMEFLRRLREELPARKGRKGASYSDVIKYLRKEHIDIRQTLEEHFTALNSVMIVYYHGNTDKAHITTQLHSVLVKALNSDNDYKVVSRGLIDIMEE